MEMITILMPCKAPYPQYFNEALQCVIKQTSGNWKLLVICEAEERLVIEQLMGGLQQDRRIKVINNRTKLISGALNSGMQQTDTEYACILLSDDLLSTNAVEVLEQNIREFPHIDMFHSANQVIDDEGNKISAIIAPREKIVAEKFVEWGQTDHLHCWKVESALKIGGIDESLGPHAADDYDFPWCMAEAGYSFRAIPECLYFYRDHRKHYRLTTHVPKSVQIEEFKKIFRKHKVPEAKLFEAIQKRESWTFKQAVYLDEKDKQKKISENYDIQKGWRKKYT